MEEEVFISKENIMESKVTTDQEKYKNLTDKQANA